MISKKKWILILLVLVACIASPEISLSQNKVDASKIQLANRYYQEKEFEKAAVLFKEIYSQSRSKSYLDKYLNSLIELNEFEEAEKIIRKQFRKTNDPSLLVHWGYILKLQNQIEAANAKFAQAIKIVSANKGMMVELANTFISRREFEWAEKVYRKGKEKLPSESFSYELARVYLYQRDYELMLQQYLDMLSDDEKSLSRVQSGIRSAMRNAMDESLPELMRSTILKRIQNEPSILAYNRLLVWYFLQEQNYEQAFRQAVALDKRTGDEEDLIMMAARSAKQNKAWAAAHNLFDYIIEKGGRKANILEARVERMESLNEQFLTEGGSSISSEQLESEFFHAISLLGIIPESAKLINPYAHFLAFHQEKADEAIKLLYEGMKAKGIQKFRKSEMKAELADVHVYKNDPWEAVLLYSQVAEENRNSAIADEANLKKARLAYYMGQMNWAQAQLDVIKASTSKLVANDALELSIFISNHINLDTTQVPMQLFARSDLLTFQNKADEAWLVLDSIEQQFPFHNLLDDVYYRKANMKLVRGEYEDAVSYLSKIISDYAYDLLADDALFQLAEIKEKYLGQNDEARELYKKLLVQYPGSIHVVEARKRFRKLRGDNIE